MNETANTDKAPAAAEIRAGNAPVLTLKSVAKTYKQAGGDLTVLRDVSLSIKPGEMVALVGPSGAGKSTLLHIAGLLDKPSSGRVIVNAEDMSKASDRERTRARRRWIGFVYQYHHLLPEFSALENIVLPQMIAGLPRKDARERARELLAAMGLSERETHRPGKLSGGEQQRVAIARAVSNGPLLLLADEPTGNLDQHTAERVFAQLKKLVHYARIGALVATHNLALAQEMDRILQLEDGKVTELKK
jgi:lipoprotein-releasing system ATP-binding protein